MNTLYESKLHYGVDLILFLNYKNVVSATGGKNAYFYI